MFVVPNPLGDVPFKIEIAANLTMEMAEFKGRFCKKTAWIPECLKTYEQIVESRRSVDCQNEKCFHIPGDLSSFCDTADPLTCLCINGPGGDYCL